MLPILLPGDKGLKTHENRIPNQGLTVSQPGSQTPVEKKEY